MNLKIKQYLKNIIGSPVYKGLPTREPILNVKGYSQEFFRVLGAFTLIVFWFWYGGKFYGVI
jgi:hypothetical protein